MVGSQGRDDSGDRDGEIPVGRRSRLRLCPVRPRLPEHREPEEPHAVEQQEGSDGQEHIGSLQPTEHVLLDMVPKMIRASVNRV